MEFVQHGSISTILDDDLRRSYLENVPDNPQILKETKESGIAKD